SHLHLIPLYSNIFRPARIVQSSIYGYLQENTLWSIIEIGSRYFFLKKVIQINYFLSHFRLQTYVLETVRLELATKY
ncbi:hypothetical protein L9F63_026798, partial [Diploptera punctata]